MTSIEWLIEQIKEYDFTPPSNNEEYVILMTKWIFDAKIDEALEMHKQEIIDAYNKSFELRDKPYSTAEKYYQETFVSKGSDDHISDISKMVDVPQEEISDEEIEKAAPLGNPTLEDGFIRGARWYREQLKNKSCN
jgi:hypothetical protein